MNRTIRRRAHCIFVACVAVVTHPAIGGECEPHWDNSIGITGNGMSGFVANLVEFDGALHASGAFTHAGGTEVNFIARWDHDTGTWSDLDGGADDWVRWMLVFDDGTGPALYVAGHFSTIGTPGVTASRVAKWDGSSWSALGDGFNGNVQALAVFDDGNGPALYAGGQFTSSGDVSVSHIARWNPGTQTWLPLESGTSGTVWGLGVWDDGNGEALYVVGSFSSAGGVAGTSRVAKWDGTEWSALGLGTTAPNPGTSVQQAHAVIPFQGELYVGGAFGEMSGVPETTRVAKWDGTSWSSVGGGIPSGTGSIWITGWGLFDDGTGGGEALYAGGTFDHVGSILANRIARWDGNEWSALGDDGIFGFNVVTLTPFDDGSGPDLYIGGVFDLAGGMVSFNIATWRGCAEPVEPKCPGDLTGSGTVGVPDLLALLSCWGAVLPGCEAADLTQSGTVGVPDLLLLLGGWGACPR